MVHYDTSLDRKRTEREMTFVRSLRRDKSLWNPDLFYKKCILICLGVGVFFNIFLVTRVVKAGWTASSGNNIRSQITVHQERASSLADNGGGDDATIPPFVSHANDVWIDEKIPRTLWFTYKSDILETETPKAYHDNIKKTIKSYRDAWGGIKIRVEFVDDDRCAALITEVYPVLLKYFLDERYGPFRADICRIIVLFKEGGYYFDVDLEIIEPLLFLPEVSFASVRARDGNTFFQAFVASSKGHPILRSGLKYMIAAYEGYDKQGMVGPETLWYAYTNMPKEERGETVLLEEIHLHGELHPEVPRQIGGGCCCNFAVHNPQDDRVYFKSRFVGSGPRCFQQTIPHKIWFIHEHDILESGTPEILHDNVRDTIKSYREAWKDPTATARVLDKSQCEAIILEVDLKLAQQFRDGGSQYWPDLCRVCVLFLYGGYYFSVDAKVIQPLVLSDEVSFSALTTNKNDESFQLFLASVPQHILLSKAVANTIAVGEGTFNVQKRAGVEVFLAAYEGIPKENWGEFVILNENALDDLQSVFPLLQNQNGEGCCCNDIVYDPERQVAHFYSHLAGAGTFCSNTQTIANDRIYNPNVIPRIIWFTGKDDILVTKEPKVVYENILNTVQSYNNIWKDDMTVHFLSDSQCSDMIYKVEPKLVPYFQKELHRETKTDICRYATLYMNGGYFFDSELKVTTPLILDPQVTFSSVLQPHTKVYFQAFMASVPQKPLLLNTLTYFLTDYEKRDQFTNIELQVGSSPLRSAMEELSPEDREAVFLLEEFNLEDQEDYNDFPLQDGHGCCCNFAVHDPVIKQVYFMSRIAGYSKRCMLSSVYHST